MCNGAARIPGGTLTALLAFITLGVGWLPTTCTLARATEAKQARTTRACMETERHLEPTAAAGLRRSSSAAALITAARAGDAPATQRRAVRVCCRRQCMAKSLGSVVCIPVVLCATKAQAFSAEAVGLRFEAPAGNEAGHERARPFPQHGRQNTPLSAFNLEAQKGITHALSVVWWPSTCTLATATDLQWPAPKGRKLRRAQEAVAPVLHDALYHAGQTAAEAVAQWAWKNAYEQAGVGALAGVLWYLASTTSNPHLAAFENAAVYTLFGHAGVYLGVVQMTRARSRCRGIGCCTCARAPALGRTAPAQPAPARPAPARPAPAGPAPARRASARPAHAPARPAPARPTPARSGPAPCTRDACTRAACDRAALACADCANGPCTYAACACAACACAACACAAGACAACACAACAFAACAGAACVCAAAARTAPTRHAPARPAPARTAPARPAPARLAPAPPAPARHAPSRHAPARHASARRLRGLRMRGMRLRGLRQRGLRLRGRTCAACACANCARAACACATNHLRDVGTAGWAQFKGL